MCIASTVLLSSCGSAGEVSPTDGVIFGGDESELCIPAGAGDKVAFGDLLTAGATDLTITEVDLVGADNLRLDDALVLPEEGLVGSDYFPPQDLPGWFDRTEAGGSLVPAGRRVSLLMAVSRPSAESDGYASAVELSYVNVGEARERTNTTSVRVATSCE